jgi:hypothetical protein
MVRPLAGRLQADGLKVWSDERVFIPGDSIPTMEEGLEQSPVPARSAVTSGRKCKHLLGWAVLARPGLASEREPGADTFRSLGPQNLGRRSIPVRRDDAGAHMSTTGKGPAS